MNKVVILQHRLLHYRLGLFEQLREHCMQIGIHIDLVHGQPTRRELQKNDVGTLDWANIVKNRYIEVGDKDWLWQTFPAEVSDADLIIMMQENRLLSNYPLIMSRTWARNRKIAYWGHGANFQSNSPGGITETWKKFLINKVDWWFAYTQMSVDLVKTAGFPESKITCLNNAIDNESFIRDLESIKKAELDLMRKTLGIKQDAHVGIFCGSLYYDKKIGLLLESIDKVHQSSPEFHCIVLGDGPLKPLLLAAAEKRPWLHVMGVVKGREKALFFRLANIMLNPGLVGLHIVDAFCAGLVMVTTANAKHSPEISYLRNNKNGLIVDDGAYASTVIDLLRNEEKFDIIKNNALRDSTVYTLDNMVKNFVGGIQQCLNMDKQ